MLYIMLDENSPTPDYEWHVGKPVPDILDKVVQFQADGDELDLLLTAMRKTRTIKAAARNTHEQS